MNPETGTGASLLTACDSAELLRCLYEQSPDAMLVFDSTDLRVIDANRAAISINESLGSQPSGLKLTDLFEVDQDAIVRELLDACRSGQPLRMEKQLRLKQSVGDGVVARLRVNHFTSGNGQRGVLVMKMVDQHLPASETTAREIADRSFDNVVRDSGFAESLTDARAAKRRLIVQDRAISVAPLGIVIADATRKDLPIVYCNPAFERMTGYSLAEALGRNCRFLQCDDQQQSGVETLRQAIVQQQDCTAVVRNYRKDGQMFWCEVRVSPVRDSAGRLTHFIGIQNDITQRVELNQQLEKSQRALQNAQSRACLGSWEYHPSTGEATWSQEMYRLHHGDPSQDAPREIRQFAMMLHQDDREAVIDRHRRIRESDHPVAHLDLRTNPELGPVRWLDSSAARVADDSACGYHIAGTVLDVTDRKLAEMALRESEHRFRTLCQHSAMGIFLADVRGRCTYVNESGCAMVGQTPVECSGDGWANALHPDDKTRVAEQWRQTVQLGGTLDLECRFIHSSGNVVWSRIRSSVHRNDNHELVGHIGSCVDITSQKVAQEKLQQSERRYRALVEHAPDAIVVLDPQTRRFVDFNNNALHLFGCDAAAMRQGGPKDFSPDRQPDGRSSRVVAGEYIEKAIAGENPVFEWWHRDLLGQDVPCEVRLLRLDLDSRVFVRGSITDITERKRADQQLWMTRFALESADDAMFVIDGDARFVDVNSVACSRLGYSRQELINMTVSDINPDYPMDAWQDHWQEVKHAGRLVFESTHTRSDGTKFPVEISKSFFKFGGNEYALAFAKDIHSRKAVEEELRYTKFAIDKNRGAISQVDSSGAFIYANDSTCEHLGYSRDELLNLHVWDVDPNWPREAWDERWEAIKRKGSISVETVNRRKNGVLRDVEVTADHFIVDGEEFLFAYAIDITERKRTEERLREREAQLAHVSRLSTMGEMVAGIAHELNQPLYSIVNYSKATGNVIKTPTAESMAQIEAWNEQIGTAATRAGQIIRRMRGFVQRESTYLVTDLHEIIRDALELVRHESERAGITLRVDRRSTDSDVRVDRVQIQQVLVNLLVNAIEAIDQHDCEIREIVVTISRSDDGMQVTVADTGPGIAWEDERSMFAAFETTKKDGMGMGLAISNTIIETFGGRLWTSNNGRAGATFCFTLPTGNSEVSDAS